MRKNLIALGLGLYGFGPSFTAINPPLSSDGYGISKPNKVSQAKRRKFKRQGRKK